MSSTEASARELAIGGNQEPIEAAEQIKKDEEVHEYADARLKSLVKSDDMYYALEYFLLGDPQRQVTQLGDSESLLQKGDDAKSKNNYIIARTNYESAAKVEIYKGNKDAARKCLVKGLEAAEEDDKRSRLMTTLIDSIDEALSVAKSYYDALTTAQTSYTPSITDNPPA